MDDLKSIIGKVATGATLSRDEAASAFDSMMSGEATPSQMGGLLMALRVRGETVEEITGAVTAMREKMLRVAAPAGAIDVVGTGGDASGSYNISTCAAFIVAGGGVAVAQHGHAALENGAVRSFEITPEEVGLKRTKPEVLRGGDANANAQALADVLKGKKGPYCDVAIMNAAAGLVVAGRAQDLKAGVALAAKAVDSGQAE